VVLVGVLDHIEAGRPAALAALVRDLFRLLLVIHGLRADG
jgi:hypothetical protein